jgi:hypothetical protein
MRYDDWYCDNIQLKLEETLFLLDLELNHQHLHTASCHEKKRAKYKEEISQPQATVDAMQFLTATLRLESVA